MARRYDRPTGVATHSIAVNRFGLDRDLRFGPKPSLPRVAKTDHVTRHESWCRSEGVTWAVPAAPARLTAHLPKVCSRRPSGREILPPRALRFSIPPCPAFSITWGAMRVARCARESAERGSSSSGFRPGSSRSAMSNRDRRPLIVHDNRKIDLIAFPLQPP